MSKVTLGGNPIDVTGRFPQAGDAAHPQPRIDHRQRVAAHLAGAGGVINRLAVAPRGIEQFGVGAELLAGDEFGQDVRRQRGGLGDAAGVAALIAALSIAVHSRTSRAGRAAAG
mgnify:CR=1 FL=1